MSRTRADSSPAQASPDQAPAPTILALLGSLRAKDVRLWAEEGQLRYSAPAGALTPDLRGRLAEHRAELLGLLSGTAGEEGRDAAPLRPTSRESPLPLSYAQQRLWFLDALEPDSAAYNVPAAFRLVGPLDVAALERSINEILRRHEVLRTAIGRGNGRPEQVIAASRPAPLGVIHLSADSGREESARRLIDEEARRPFDLTHDPMLRAVLLRLGAEEHVLLVVMHHIASDGWSLSVLTRELAAMYGAFLDGRPSPLPELPVQYADYAVWQRDWLRGDVLERQLAYWRRQLAGVPVLELPTDRPRPPTPSFRGARQARPLSPALADALRALSRAEGVTLFMTLLAAFQTLLLRYTGLPDLAVGSPIANRTRPELEGLIGFFVNTLVLRTDLSGDPSFRALLARVRTVALDAFAHQDLPFEKLVEDLNPTRTLSHSPLFQTLFVLQNTPPATLTLPGLAVTPLPVDRGTVKFDLTLTLLEEGPHLRALADYSTDLFDPPTITRLLAHFETLLTGLVADPDQPLSALPVLPPAERHQLLVAWNRTATPAPPDVCLPQLFEAQVQRTPDACAVVFEHQPLTYRALNARANQLAHRLRALGVGPERLVGLCLERSLDLLVGLLGILKAGGAYVPLDPTYPPARLAFLLQDTRAPVVLTQSRLLSRLPPHSAHVLCLDDDGAALAQEPTHDPAPAATPDTLAYVIYTSGSTGQPKGVMVEHRSLVNYLEWANRCLIGDEIDVLPATSRPSFDASLKQLFGPLVRGRTVWMPSDDLAADPGALLTAVQGLGRVGVNCVPSFWRAFLDVLDTQGGDAPVAGLTRLILGGERLDRDLVDRTFARLPHLEVFNTYGPTEATANATAIRIRPGEDITIGRPMSHAQIYLLDAHLAPVPIGVPGELHIGGAGVARGYLGQPGLTGERFIADPFTDRPGARLYKTGDIARYRSDGNIEFLGRADDQVKIRGFRVELGEIEAVLGQHPAVHATVVVARQDGPGDLRLVAYWVTRQGRDASPEDLRGFLKRTLPDYMVPTTYVRLDALPLMPTGKVDRRALPPSGPACSEPPTGVVAPRTPLESGLAEIWATLLGRERVGIHDDFFELGGHSLLATQIVARVRATFQTELPLRRLFETPTIAGLAAAIEEVRAGGAGLRGSALSEGGIQRRRPGPANASPSASFAQERLWFLDQLEPGRATYNLPVAFRLSGPLDMAALEQSLDEIRRRHEVLRTTFAATDGHVVQIVAPAAPQPLPTVDLRELPAPRREPEARRLAAVEVQRPFDLAQGPLLRATLLRLTADEHLLLLTLHHIVTDGWSTAILLRELSALYAAFAAGQPSPLPELPIQYADFAVWQRDWLQGDVLATQLAYWRRQLAGPLPVLPLPTDRPRPDTPTASGARQRLVLQRSLTERLEAVSRRHGVTLFMTLLAAFQTLLHRHTGEDDVVVGTPIAGRTRPELESLIGFFVNTLVLRTSLGGNPSFGEVLGRVREVALGAYAHQDLPFEKLVQELNPERDLRRNPLFDVMFNMTNVPSSAITLPGVAARSVELGEPESKFLLTLYAKEQDGELHLQLLHQRLTFSAERAVSMLQQYRNLLEQMAAAPDRPIGPIPS